MARLRSVGESVPPIPPSPHGAGAVVGQVRAPDHAQGCRLLGPGSLGEGPCRGWDGAGLQARPSWPPRGTLLACGSVLIYVALPTGCCPPVWPPALALSCPPGVCLGFSLLIEALAWPAHLTCLCCPELPGLLHWPQPGLPSWPHLWTSWPGSHLLGLALRPWPLAFPSGLPLPFLWSSRQDLPPCLRRPLAVPA